MKPLTREWVAKAEDDYRLARAAFASVDTPSYDGVCFHAQPAVEKYLKAVLQERDISFPRIHDLEKLAELITPPLSGGEGMSVELGALSRMGTAARYPGYFADRAAAERA